MFFILEGNHWMTTWRCHICLNVSKNIGVLLKIIHNINRYLLHFFCNLFYCLIFINFSNLSLISSKSTESDHVKADFIHKLHCIHHFSILSLFWYFESLIPIGNYISNEKNSLGLQQLIPL